MRKQTAVIDFGSQKIISLIGEKRKKDGFDIIGSGEAEYAGFLNGEFLDKEKLVIAIKQALVNAETSCGAKITSIIVGVPACFAICVCNDVSKTYKKRTRISGKEILSLYDLVNISNLSHTHVPIHYSPIYYSLDDGTKTCDVLDLYTTRIYAKISTILVEKTFVDLISNILQQLGVNKSITFVSSQLAQSLYLLDDKHRQSKSVIIDCGHITTSVTIAEGQGLTLLNEFSLGGGYITADLMKWLKLSYTSSEALKKKLVLSLSTTCDDVYEVKAGSEMLTIPAQTANNITIAKIETIAKTIKKCLSNSTENINDAQIYLTGGGLCYIKGAKEILASKIGKNIVILAPAIPQLAKPHYSSVLSLLSYALEN